MSESAKTEVILPSDHEVKVVRKFNAPSALVYKAYTTPELMQRWLLGPPGWTMPVCEMDVRVGGQFRWRWRNIENGQEFGFHGEFRVLEPGRRIVHTEYYDPGSVGGDMGDGSLITVELTEQNGVTTMSTLMDFYTKEARDAAMSTGMTDGMEITYQRLEEMLPELGSAAA
jgi:uncharacterized protein YndB with AHSA1/START domain